MNKLNSMKRSLLILATAISAASCTQSVDEAIVGASATKKFTFTIKGDFSDEWKPVTRGYLSADGKKLTDVWVLDYMDGRLVQQLHQSDNTADEFGQPIMKLAYGTHHVYFVASRGQNPVLNTDAHTVTFEKVLDTFYKDYEVTVVATSNGNRAVTLDRVVTKLRLTFTDEIPSDAATINITPSLWYYGIDYMTGNPCNPMSSQTSTISIPASSIGQTAVQASMHSFSTTELWQTDISIESNTSDGSVIGSASLSSVPFKANRVSDYAGPLFGSNGFLDITLNDNWEDTYEGQW